MGSRYNYNNAQQIRFKSLPALSLYIHIPWCMKKCPYCDFNSHVIGTSSKDVLETKYVEALIKDLELALPLIWGRNINTVFIGGGTPSLFSGSSIDKILQTVRSYTRLLPSAEITLEANPGAIDVMHLAAYLESGVNRLSFGVQSFNNKYLHVLGRIHDSTQAKKSIELAARYIQNINLDIMYGLPNQSISDAVQDVQDAIKFAPQHISCYNLTIEPNTEFFVKPPSGLPDNDNCYAIEEAIMEQLHLYGYSRYEVSAYTKDGYQCQHNLNYWQFGDYLGIGAGAHSKLSFHDKIIRQVRHKHPQKYMESVTQETHIAENRVITPEELPFEFMLNALRLRRGILTQLFVERTGLELNKILLQLNTGVERGLLNLKGGKIVPTKLGHDFLNDLLMIFMHG